MNKPTIGFIGMGLMGGAMVARLQDCGYAMNVLGNRDRTELDKAIARGAVEKENGRQIAHSSDITMICVGTSAQVEALMRGPDGIIAGLAPGKTAIDFGTSLPASTRMLAEEVAAAGAAYLDAPIGRTPAHAREGKINLMCAGPRENFDRVKPVLDDIGENVFHLGAIGNGHTIKLLNNFCAQSLANVLAEAFAVADATGVSRRDAYDVMRAGPAGSVFMDLMAAYALDGDPNQLAFSIRNAGKDIGYYKEMTEAAGVPSVMADAPLAMMREADAAGLGDHMVPEMLDHFLKHFGRA